ncbi:YvrJ family protein [Paenibacillus camelliae]|uniref:YvrJ family protein n=1 Tax=Paenibacillus camelliae TaxID=512410 RepID=UPI00203BD033|nr:YvrJ family protein [Paenibacillus camelliae]MCM3635884.1 YvrJ family protein [Paenibacillus camelliae]
MQDTSLLSMLTSFISELGFPIAVSAFLLLRFEKKIEALSERVNALTQTLREEREKNGST